MLYLGQTRRSKWQDRPAIHKTTLSNKLINFSLGGVAQSVLRIILQNQPPYAFPHAMF